MREIKFRGKSLKSKRWIYGQLLSGNDQAAIMVINGNKLNTFDSRMVDPSTVGQYVGLNDIHGKGIYEGDVLMVEGIKTNRYSKVWWNPEKFTFYIGHAPLDAYLKNEYNLCEFCIAGNIYDNPELKEKLV